MTDRDLILRSLLTPPHFPMRGICATTKEDALRGSNNPDGPLPKPEREFPDYYSPPPHPPSSSRRSPSLGNEVEGAQLGLWDEFAQRLETLGGRMVEWDEMSETEGPVWIDEDVRQYLPGIESVEDPWSARVGITRGDLAVAEMGSVFLSAGPGRARLGSLAPEIHVVLIGHDAIVQTMEEAFEQLTTRTSVIISGPSRTADIEGVLVRGIHGPRELWVVVVSPEHRGA